MTNSEDNTLLYIIVGVMLFAVLTYLRNRQRDDDGKLPDLAVTAKSVLESIDEFVFDSALARYNPPRESDLQAQLLTHLKDEFFHVQSQKPIGGIHAKQIDFDIGRERVGVEIKMAKSLFKKAEFDRLPTQVKGYIDNYEDGNVIVAIFGSKEELSNNIKLTAIKESLADQEIEPLFIEIE